MKNLMLALALLLCTTAFAQERPKMSAEERAKSRTERLTKDLGLTADQVTRVEALNLKYAQEQEVKREQIEAERKARRDEMKTRQDAYDAEMKELLTAEQYKQWVAKREEMKEKQKAVRKEKRMEMRERREP